MASLDFNFYWVPGRCARYPTLGRKFGLRGYLAYYSIDCFFNKRPLNTTNPARHCFSKFSDLHDGSSSPIYYDVGIFHGRQFFPSRDKLGHSCLHGHFGFIGLSTANYFPASGRALSNYAVQIFSYRFSTYVGLGILWGAPKFSNVTRFGIDHNFWRVRNMARRARKAKSKSTRE